jgi:hypothetical protein
MKKEELRCKGCGKLLAHWDEKEQCSYTDIPCEEGLYIDPETLEGFCDKCFDK